MRQTLLLYGVLFLVRRLNWKVRLSEKWKGYSDACGGKWLAVGSQWSCVGSPKQDEWRANAIGGVGRGLEALKLGVDFTPVAVGGHWVIVGRWVIWLLPPLRVSPSCKWGGWVPPSWHFLWTRGMSPTLLPSCVYIFHPASPPRPSPLCLAGLWAEWATEVWRAHPQQPIWRPPWQIQSGIFPQKVRAWAPSGWHVLPGRMGWLCAQTLWAAVWEVGEC